MEMTLYIISFHFGFKQGDPDAPLAIHPPNPFGGGHGDIPKPAERYNLYYGMFPSDLGIFFSNITILKKSSIIGKF